MADIYLCGHGEWPTTGEGYIYCQVPANTTFSVYTPVGRFLDFSYTQQLLSQGPASLPADQVFSSYSNTPNLRLLPAPGYSALFHAYDANVVMVDVNTSLEELFRRYQGNDIHWCACRGRFRGLDTTEGGFNDDYIIQNN
ncbi:putative adhesin [Aquimarina rubra]|uniref:Adhesin n=1 Tax=Aquimarina rubra TaxID=1920033 RepID=A0ABW5L9P9_9FLAO